MEDEARKQAYTMHQEGKWKTWRNTNMTTAIDECIVSMLTNQQNLN